MANNYEGIKNQKFGIEIEMTGLTRARAAKAVAQHFNTTAEHLGGSYDTYIIRDNQNRKWKIVSDASIQCYKKDGTIASNLYSVELVSPICEYEDIPIIQQLVRDLRLAGGICNQSTGIHIHINAAPYDAQKLRNFVNIVASKEEMLYKALQVDSGRLTYCRKTDQEFLERLNNKKPKTLSDLQNLWYNGRDGSHMHYHNSRYHLLNLHSVFSKGTVEIRAFNSTLHAGVIRSYLVLCLAVSNQALEQKSAQCKVTQSSNPKYTFRTWLLRLGLIGEEFKNCRKHLLEHLDGCIAWKNPEDAIRQRERLKQERDAERVQVVTAQEEQREETTSQIESSEIEGVEEVSEEMNEENSYEMSM